MSPKKKWAEKLKKWRQKHEQTYAKAILTPPQRTTLYRTMPYPGCVLIMGRRRYGKSGLAHEIANQFHKKRECPAVLHLPHIPENMRRRVQKLLPDWFRVMTDYRQWPENAVVVYDEASQSAHARRSQSDYAVTLDNMIGISGQRNQMLLFISHHSRKLDLNIIHEVDRVIYKEPTYAHAIWERDEMGDFTYKAAEFFSGIRTEVSKKRANLVVDFQNFQFFNFTNGLPPWWSDDLSRLFRDIEMMMEKK